MQNFEVLDYLIKNNKQNQGGLRKNYYKFLPENMPDMSDKPYIEEIVTNLFVSQLCLATECVYVHAQGLITATTLMIQWYSTGDYMNVKAFTTYPDVIKYIPSINPMGDIIEESEKLLQSSPPDTQDLEHLKEALDILKQVCVPITKEEYDQIFKEAYDSVYK